MIETEIAEWRIVDDATWFAVQERVTTRGPMQNTLQKPGATYPLENVPRDVLISPTDQERRRVVFRSKEAAT